MGIKVRVSLHVNREAHLEKASLNLWNNEINAQSLIMETAMIKICGKIFHLFTILVMVVQLLPTRKWEDEVEGWGVSQARAPFANRASPLQITLHCIANSMIGILRSSQKAPFANRAWPLSRTLLAFASFSIFKRGFSRAPFACRASAFTRLIAKFSICKVYQVSWPCKQCSFIT